MTVTREPARPLTDDEVTLVHALLESEFPGREQLHRRLDGATCSPLDDEGNLRIIPRAGSPVADVAWRVPVEGWVADSDGATIHVLLHVVDGLVDELEIYRDDSGSLLAPISPEGLSVHALPVT